MARSFRAAVLASSDVPGRGTVAVVEVRAGKVRTGDYVMIAGLANPRTAAVSAVEAFAQDEEDRAEGALPQVGLLLTGVDKSDLPRGIELSGEEAP